MARETQIAPRYNVDPSEPEWVALWSALELKRDTREEHPENGECWQYTGTIPHTCGFVHQFQHRCHPDFNRRINANVMATKDWVPAQEAAANGR